MSAWIGGSAAGGACGAISEVRQWWCSIVRRSYLDAASFGRRTTLRKAAANAHNLRVIMGC